MAPTLQHICCFALRVPNIVRSIERYFVVALHRTKCVCSNVPTIMPKYNLGSFSIRTSAIDWNRVRLFVKWIALYRPRTRRILGEMRVETIYVRQRLYVFEIIIDSQRTYKAEPIRVFFLRPREMSAVRRNWFNWIFIDYSCAENGFSFVAAMRRLPPGHCLPSEMNLNGFYRNDSILKAFNHYYLLDIRIASWCHFEFSFIAFWPWKTRNVDGKTGKPLAYFGMVANMVT